MMNKLFFTALMFVSALSAGAQTVGQQFGPSSASGSSTPQLKFVPADNANYSYMGRVSTAVRGAVRFTYPGVSVQAEFKGRAVAASFKPGSGFFMVEIDNNLPYKLCVSSKDSVMLLAENLRDGHHQIRLMYCQEGYEQRPAFYGLFTEDGTIDRMPLPERRILYIGNSITCGYGVEANVPNVGFTYDTENHFYTYAAITARELNAQHHAVARSGIGIYKNYGGPRGGSIGTTMPDKFDLTLFTEMPDFSKCERWDHSSYQPQVICVNLGTNDTSLDTYDTGLMHKAYVAFIHRLRKLYPDAHIIMLSGSMMSGKALADCNAVLDAAVKEVADPKVLRFNFAPQTGSLGYGADWHPSIRQQRKMADELIPFIRNITGWTK